jgi:hypothetical protein
MLGVRVERVYGLLFFSVMNDQNNSVESDIYHGKIIMNKNKNKNNEWN